MKSVSFMWDGARMFDWYSRGTFSYLLTELTVFCFKKLVFGGGTSAGLIFDWFMTSEVGFMLSKIICWRSCLRFLRSRTRGSATYFANWALSCCASVPEPTSSENLANLF